MKNEPQDHRDKVKGDELRRDQLKEYPREEFPRKQELLKDDSAEDAEDDTSFPAGESLPPLPTTGVWTQAEWEKTIVGPDRISTPSYDRYDVTTMPEAPIVFAPATGNDLPKKMSGLLRFRVIRLARVVKNHRWPSNRNYMLKVLKSFSPATPYHGESRAVNVTLVDGNQPPNGDDLSDLGILGQEAAGFEYILFVSGSPNYLHMAVPNNLLALWEEAPETGTPDAFNLLAYELHRNDAGWDNYLSLRRAVASPQPLISFLPPDPGQVRIRPAAFRDEMSQGEILLSTAESRLDIAENRLGRIPKVYFADPDDRYRPSGMCNLDFVPSPFFGMPDVEQVSLESLQISLRSISDEDKPLLLTQPRALQVIINHLTNPTAKIREIEGSGRYQGIVFDIPPEIGAQPVVFLEDEQPAGNCLTQILDSMTTQTSSKWHWTGRNRITISEEP
ncbi:MAG: hypothetical protein AABP62_14830 [Planctomycetota bacterium]